MINPHTINMRASRKLIQILLIALACLCENAKAEEWLLYAEQNGVRIEYKHSDCDLERGFDQEWVLLRVTNTSGEDKLVRWKANLWYNDHCKTCEIEGQEYFSSFSINAGKEISGICSINGIKGLNFFVKFIDPQYKNTDIQILTKFELGDLSITKAE